MQETPAAEKEVPVKGKGLFSKPMPVPAVTVPVVTVPSVPVSGANHKHHCLVMQQDCMLIYACLYLSLYLSLIYIYIVYAYMC